MVVGLIPRTCQPSRTARAGPRRLRRRKLPYHWDMANGGSGWSFAPDYLSSQLPMIWQPNADYQLNEIANNLKGVAPLSPTLSINPENWYFVK
jgi:hypothetical protein